jgi:hypothetical protein
VAVCNTNTSSMVVDTHSFARQLFNFNSSTY